VTLGVADLARATRFYQALGWPLSSGSEPGEVSFFRTAGGLLALWGAKDLADDLGLSPSAEAGFRATALAMNLDGPAQVDEALSAAGAAGGKILKAGTKTAWGYQGYFTVALRCPRATGVISIHAWNMR